MSITGVTSPNSSHLFDNGFMFCQQTDEQDNGISLESIFNKNQKKLAVGVTGTAAFSLAGLFLSNKTPLTNCLKQGSFFTAGVFALFTAFQLYKNYQDTEKRDFSDLNIYVLDKFKESSHGDKVCSVILDGLPNANLTKIEFDGINSLEKILNDVRMGKKIDAINFSQTHEDSFPFNEINVYKNGEKININMNNLLQYKLEIKEAILNNIQSKDNEKYNNLLSIIQIIEELTDRGVKFFQSNNNECAKKLTFSDLWDFNTKYPNANNPNLITVSANDSDTRSTSLSDEKAPSVVTRGCEKIEGNSFATPFALTRFFRGHH